MSILKGSLSDHDRGLIKSIEDQYNMVHKVLGSDPLIYYLFSVLPPVEDDMVQPNADLTNKRQEVFRHGPAMAPSKSEEK